MDHPFPSPRVYVLLASFGLKGQQGESLSRHPAVSVQFSPLMSWTTTLPVQDSSEGTTSPTPLPLRVGAKAMTCSGPSWRRYSLPWRPRNTPRSEEHTSELQSLMRISYAVFCLKKKNTNTTQIQPRHLE